MSTSVYVIQIMYPDGVAIVHARCFGSELAARCCVEALAKGRFEWLARTLGIDEHNTEFEVRQLVMWRYTAEHAA